MKHEGLLGGLLEMAEIQAELGVSADEARKLWRQREGERLPAEPEPSNVIQFPGR